MIKLVFTISNEVFTLTIENKEIWYCDRKLIKKVRLIPRDETIAKQIALSRNKLPPSLLNMFNLNEEEKKEYDSCNTEEEICTICIRDCKKQGARLQKKE